MNFCCTGDRSFIRFCLFRNYSIPGLCQAAFPRAPAALSANSHVPGRWPAFPLPLTLAMNRSEMLPGFGLLAHKGACQAAVLFSQDPGDFPSGACQEKRQRTAAVQDAVAPCQRSKGVPGPNACAKRKGALPQRGNSCLRFLHFRGSVGHRRPSTVQNDAIRDQSRRGFSGRRLRTLYL